jgi:predicted ester cyclase
MSQSDVARVYFDRQNAGDIDGALGQFAAGARFLGPMGMIPFPEGVRAYLEGFAESFPGNGFEITNVFGSGDQVAVEGFWFGTHNGPLSMPDGAQMAATGKAVRAPFATLFTIQDGKIVEHRGYWDMAGFLTQLRD